MLIKNKRFTLNSFQIIALGFFAVILIGALILMLPISSKSGEFTPFVDSLFTATTSVCVTGLVVRDTGTYWSVFGQSVILILIQIGGLGVITVAASLTMLTGKKIGLGQRSTMQEAVAAPKVGGIVKLTNLVLKGTFLFELIGALAMMPTFISDFGAKGIWMSFFHSISAFCNAGIDLMGVNGKYSSMTGYSDNLIINITLMLLIIIGGIGFLTWEDIKNHKLRISHYRLQSKIILTTSFALILFPALFFFFYEYNNLPIKQRILYSLFQAVTPRTAGFNTTDLTAMSGVGRAIMIILMLIGGAPGSTAGGMKITTFALLIASAFSVFRHKEDTEAFGRRIDNSIVRNASAILILYLTMCFTGAAVISIAESLPFTVSLFETSSAVATVGLSLGITPSLGILSKLILTFLMYAGRIGGLTLIFAAIVGTNKKLSKFPQEKIMVG